MRSICMFLILFCCACAAPVGATDSEALGETAQPATWCCYGISQICHGDEVQICTPLEWCGDADDENQAAGAAMLDWFYEIPDPDAVSCKIRPVIMDIGTTWAEPMHRYWCFEYWYSAKLGYPLIVDETKDIYARQNAVFPPLTAMGQYTDWHFDQWGTLPGHNGTKPRCVDITDDL